MDAQGGAGVAGMETVAVGAHVAEVLRSKAASMRRSARSTHRCVAEAYERRARELERGADLVDAILMTAGSEQPASARAATTAA